MGDSGERGPWVAVFADGTERVIEQAVTPEEFVTGTCPTCGGWGTYRGCSACNDTGCSLYTARRWSPGADRPEDDRCVNCGRDEAAHSPSNEADS